MLLYSTLACKKIWESSCAWWGLNRRYQKFTRSWYNFDLKTTRPYYFSKFGQFGGTHPIQAIKYLTVGVKVSKLFNIWRDPSSSYCLSGKYAEEKKRNPHFHCQFKLTKSSGESFKLLYDILNFSFRAYLFILLILCRHMAQKVNDR